MPNRYCRSVENRKKIQLSWLKTSNALVKDMTESQQTETEARHYSDLKGGDLEEHCTPLF